MLFCSLALFVFILLFRWFPARCARSREMCSELRISQSGTEVFCADLAGFMKIFENWRGCTSSSLLQHMVKQFIRRKRRFLCGYNFMYRTGRYHCGAHWFEHERGKPGECVDDQHRNADAAIILVRMRFRFLRLDSENENWRICGDLMNDAQFGVIIWLAEGYWMDYLLICVCFTSESI